jgi:hypothetical protein
MNIYDFADEEHRLTHEAEETHGDYFVNAAGATLAFSKLVGIPLTDCETFFRFHALAKKHHTTCRGSPWPPSPDENRR